MCFPYFVATAASSNRRNKKKDFVMLAAVVWFILSALNLMCAVLKNSYVSARSRQAIIFCFFFFVRMHSKGTVAFKH